MLFDRLADIIMKHPKKIVLIWIALLLVSSPFIYNVLVNPGSVLSYDMTEMSGDDSESVQGLEIIYDQDRFFQPDVGVDILLVFECADPSEREAVLGFEGALADALADEYGEGAVEMMDMGTFSKAPAGYPGIAIVSMGFSDDREATDEVANLRAAISDAKGADPAYSGLTTYLTGSVPITQDTETGAMEDIMRIDPFSILLVLVLIGLFFRSLISAATPPITIGFAYGVLMTVICGVAMFTDIFYITSTIALVAMLGAGCDYCIFIIARYREERKAGRDKEGALREAVVWAGESITTSGLSVIIGFGVLSFCSFSLISTMGIVLASGIVFALLAALTLIPSILAIVGDRIFYPSTIDTYRDGSRAMSGLYGKVSRLGEAYFKKSARFSIKYAPLIIAVAALVTVPLAYVAATEGTSYDMISIMPHGESKEGVDAIVENADGGMIMPTYIVLDAGRQIAEIEDGKIKIPKDGEMIELGSLTWTTPDLVKYLSLSDPASEDGLAGLISKGTTDSEGESNVSSVMGIVSWDAVLGMATQKAYPVVMNHADEIKAGIYAELMASHSEEIVQGIYAEIMASHSDEVKAGIYAQSLEPCRQQYMELHPEATEEEAASAAKAMAAQIAEEQLPAAVQAMAEEQLPEVAMQKAEEAAAGEIVRQLPSVVQGAVQGILDIPDALWPTGCTKSNAIDYILNYTAGSLSKFVDGEQYIKLTVVTKDQPMSDLSIDTIGQVEGIVDEYMGTEEAQSLFTGAFVTGSVTVLYEISEVVGSEFNWIELAVVILIFLLLFFVMRSYLTPARSILTIVMSIVWTLGVTHLLFGHLLGVPITWIVPIVLFVICLGLGMDYDILLTTRIKENVSKGMSNDDAIAHAVEKSGAVITICGLIMGGAFSTMALSTSPMLCEFGFALGFAILVDALLVRTYIVPAVMHLLGRWNWVGPKWLAGPVRGGRE